MFWEISAFFQQIFMKWPYKQNPWKIQDNQYIIGKAGDFQSVILLNSDSLSDGFQGICL